MTTINESYFLQNKPKPTSTTGQSGLGKDDFLKLLITQLQNQDPSNPMDDREFIAQMAQFSSLEQMTNMNTTIQKFVDTQTSQSLVQFSELIGKEVKWVQEVDVDDYRTELQYSDNKVQSVKVEFDGTIRILLDNNRWIHHEQLTQVSGVQTNGTNKPSEEESETSK
ncbi:flagellar hook assembly protein FlgD [Alkalihalophilus lindianensis]|uniref:Flagellar hook assembly protein FlgD n=1 Tax=Alkalihalophilus lindianensis TaxID=1630542 RepID=A0ABU3XC20_9BACI|nr:flagellar hook assembly protein FlgD [Alkalihalophilus lindianensis]MDV2685433.1 flagellar hook assembly protein FlgD [Alkalihalophilus lindianensis]